MEKDFTIFDHIGNITDKKLSISKYSEKNLKSWLSYLINRWLSMNMELIEIVNEFQKYTIGILSPKETYQLYYDILPKRKFYSKYVKGKKQDKYNSKLVELFAKHYMSSETDAIEYLDILSVTGNTADIERIIKLYGKNDKEVKQLLKP